MIYRILVGGMVVYDAMVAWVNTHVGVGNFLNSQSAWEIDCPRLESGNKQQKIPYNLSRNDIIF